jgi:hypothetical protein
MASAARKVVLQHAKHTFIYLYENVQLKRNKSRSHFANFAKQLVCGIRREVQLLAVRGKRASGLAHKRAFSLIRVVKG